MDCLQYRSFHVVEPLVPLPMGGSGFDSFLAGDSALEGVCDA